MRALNNEEINLLKIILENISRCFMEDKPWIINIACKGSENKPNVSIMSCSSFGDYSVKEDYLKIHGMIMDHVEGRKNIVESAKDLMDKAAKQRDGKIGEIKNNPDGTFEIKF